MSFFHNPKIQNSKSDLEDGYRRLLTIKEKLGYRHEVVDRQLAHAPLSKIDRAYDRAKFLDDRIKMMQEWADYVDKMASQ